MAVSFPLLNITVSCELMDMSEAIRQPSCCFAFNLCTG